jgi:hypothetical protein
MPQPKEELERVLRRVLGGRWDEDMPVKLDHTIVTARDKTESATFDSVLGRVKARSVPYWADPRQTRPGEVDQRGNGRAIYFADPSGHWLEVLTRN